MNRRSFGATVTGAIGMLLAPWLGRNAREDRAGTFLGYTRAIRVFRKIPNGPAGDEWIRRAMEHVGSVNAEKWACKPPGVVTFANLSVQSPAGEESARYADCLFALVPEGNGRERRRMSFTFFALFYPHSDIARPDWALDIRAT